MRRWKPQRSAGLWVGLLLLIALMVAVVPPATRLSAMLSGSPTSWPFNLQTYGLLVLLLGLLILIATLTYRVVSAVTLSYELDRNGLYIRWIGNRAVIPLDLVQNIDAGAMVQQRPWDVLRGIGFYSGQTRTIGNQPAHLFSTRSPARSLAITLPDSVYIISPADVDSFVQDLEQRRNLGATKPLSSMVEPSRMFLYAFWNDRTVRRLVLAAFTLNLLVLALLATRYPELAPEVQMRFNSVGEAAELRPRHQVLFLPLAATALSLLNIAFGLLIYRSQQIGARLLQMSSVLVQVLFGIAVITIIR